MRRATYDVTISQDDFDDQDTFEVTINKYAGRNLTRRVVEVPTLEAVLGIINKTYGKATNV